MSYINGKVEVDGYGKVLEWMEYIQNTWVKSKMGNLMVGVLNLKLMEDSILVSGRLVKNMVKEQRLLQMETHMKVNGRMGNKMVKGNGLYLMDLSM